MALSQDEIIQATELLSINERRLRVRDRQIERLGDNAPPEVVLEAEDLRVKISALKAVLTPELPDEISGLVKRRLEDDYFIFQTTLAAKQDVAVLREDVAKIKVEQGLASTWRMQTGDRLLGIEQQVTSSEQNRVNGSLFYRRGLMIALIIGALALALGVALAFRVTAGGI